MRVLRYGVYDRAARRLELWSLETHEVGRKNEAFGYRALDDALGRARVCVALFRSSCEANNDNNHTATTTPRQPPPTLTPSPTQNRPNQVLETLSIKEGSAAYTGKAGALGRRFGVNVAARPEGLSSGAGGAWSKTTYLAHSQVPWPGLGQRQQYALQYGRRKDLAEPVCQLCGWMCVVGFTAFAPLFAPAAHHPQPVHSPEPDAHAPHLTTIFVTLLSIGECPPPPVTHHRHACPSTRAVMKRACASWA